MVVSEETLVRFLDPQQLLILRSRGIEDCLTIALAVGKGISAKLRLQRRHFDMLRIGQRGFLIRRKTVSSRRRSSSLSAAFPDLTKADEKNSPLVGKEDFIFPPFPLQLVQKKLPLLSARKNR